jgi:hypothetical protein
MMNRLHKVHFSSFMFRLGIAFATILGVATSSAAADATSIAGNWEGTVDAGARSKKRIVVHINVAQDESLSGTIDYPDQDASGTAITVITYKEAILHFESAPGLAAFDGTVNKEKTEINGTWSQNGVALSLTLKRTP